jgi:hypothetical protein
MTEYGDKIDRVRTELARYKSLLKAQIRKNSILASENEALRKDSDRLDELMSAIAMEWVKMPALPRGQPPSPLDVAIINAAHFTTGLHRIKKEKENGGHLGEAEADVSNGSPE